MSNQTSKQIPRARPLFVGGTASNVGKSWMVTAMCAWLRRRGVRVAPFKAQTMSNHSFPCRDGGEIGRAQVAQAEACGLEPETAMNPILLKPNANGTSQVIVRGKVWRTLTPREYYREVDHLLQEVLEAYEDLAGRFDVVVMEGAGSVSEVNLRDGDVVNLRLVAAIAAPWVLVSDVERGGVFASILGTMSLLTPVERSLFRGFLVNKFRGDRSLFDEGRRTLEARTGAPCLGVFPYAEDLRLDAEDSLALDIRPRTVPPVGRSIAIVRWPRLSNGTDFRLLTWADWITRPSDQQYDFIVLPGTKDTIADLAWMSAQGLGAWVRDQYARGATVIGICGGFQALGLTITDPHGMESIAGTSEGLGLLPVVTTLLQEKTTCVRRATTPGGATFAAYEIHLGATSGGDGMAPFAMLEDGRPEGVRAGRLYGTYLHGALEDAAVVREIFGVDVDPVAAKSDEHAAMADWFDQYAVDPAAWVG